MKKILVPVDFSPTSEKAFIFASDMASRAKASIIMYHLYTPLSNAFIGNGQKYSDYNSQTEINLLKRMERMKKRLSGNSGDVVVSTVLGHTPLPDSIPEFAEQNLVDLIVMGTQGASGLKKVIIGSVAVRIMEQADIPVLLIPEKYEWREPGEIVFATNYLQTDKKAFEVVKDIAGLYGAPITIVHVYDAFLNDQQERQKFEKYEAAMRHDFEDCALKFRLMKAAEVGHVLENLSKEIAFDMIAMVRREKTFVAHIFHKSATKDIAYITHQPLLIIPSEAA